MNPNEMGNGLTLNISGRSNEQDQSLVMETAKYDQIENEDAEAMLKSIQQNEPSGC
jgi:hypothetical protein